MTDKEAAMVIALLFTILFALCGLCISIYAFRSQPLIRRIWLGLVLGLLLLTWLPSLFAFVLGFTVWTQVFALLIAIALAFASLALFGLKRVFGSLHARFLCKDLACLYVIVPLFVLGAVLFSTHILMERPDGSLAVGQVTYGDLAMHLGFISSIAEQGTFPPQYSIFPGHMVNYPFLCETSASSLVVLGATLRQAYLITALYAYLLVLAGVYFFFQEWLKTRRRAAIGTVLFFLGGGFGFAYFFDLAKNGASLNALLDGGYFSNFSWLLDGFYDTPTNLPTIGLRWVNPIVDMLIPQRATLFGWAFLFPCLTLLHGFAYRKQSENLVPLGIIAGLLPLIHTHSFLALGIISAVMLMTEMITKYDPKRLLKWFLYGGIACVIAAPQLFGFAFRQASESGMVKPHWNWANNADSYLWFYLKNFGWLFLLMPFAFFSMSSRDRKVYLAPLVLWAIAEMLVFQPNTYDNNKLLFVWFAYTCGLVGKFLDVAYRRLLHAIRKNSNQEARKKALLRFGLFLQVLLLISLLVCLRNDGSIKWYTCCTLLFLSGLSGYLFSVSALSERMKNETLLSMFPGLCSCYLIVHGFALLYRHYTQTEFSFGQPELLIAIVLLIASIVLTFVILLRCKPVRPFSTAYGAVALHLGIYVLTLTLTLSSFMTILRELKSEYQVYTASDVEAAEFVRENTAPDSMFLANSYHWNLISPLTGRNIVTGTSTFLYFHGIDNSQRETDVRSMYETPEQSKDLFETYGVNYILISNAERYNYDIDLDYIKKNCPLIFANSSAEIYQVNL